MNSAVKIPELKGKGLFVFSDPGGAKPMLALVKLSSEIKDFYFVSDRVYDFYSDFNFIIHSCPEGGEKKLIQQYKPDYIFTGTSYTSKIELRFIKAAKELRINTFAFVDHYTSFMERFLLDEIKVFPDIVYVIDNYAYELAINSQADATISISPNYYLEYLKNWETSLTKRDFLTKYNLPLDHKIIVFAPDPLSNINGKSVYGFDETTVCRDLFEALALINSTKYTLVVKMHPNQNAERLKSVIDAFNNQHVFFATDMHTNTLLYFADMIIGMFSNILLEGSLLGPPVIRYLNGLKKEDPFSKIGLGKVVYSKKQFVNEISLGLTS